MENNGLNWGIIIPLVVCLVNPILAFWQDKKSKLVEGERLISEKSLRIYFEKMLPIIEMNIAVEEKADKLVSALEVPEDKLYVSPIISEEITEILHIRESTKKSNEHECKVASTQLQKQVSTLKYMLGSEINRLRKNLGYPYHSFSRYMIMRWGFSSYMTFVISGASLTFVWLSAYFTVYYSGNTSLSMTMLIISTAIAIIPLLLYLLISPHCSHSLMYWRKKHRKISAGTATDDKKPLNTPMKKKRK